MFNNIPKNKKSNKLLYLAILVLGFFGIKKFAEATTFSEIYWDRFTGGIFDIFGGIKTFFWYLIDNIGSLFGKFFTLMGDMFFTMAEAGLKNFPEKHIPQEMLDVIPFMINSVAWFNKFLPLSEALHLAKITLFILLTLIVFNAVVYGMRYVRGN